MAVGLAVLASGLVTKPARADFYNIEGKFQCLEGIEAFCSGSGREELLPPKSESRDVSVLAEPQRPASNRSDIAPASPSPRDGSRSQTAGRRDPFQEVAKRIETGQPSNGDLRELHFLARTGDGRAIELLAWCAYAGIAQSRDPIAAYLLYGVAALADVSRATENQAVIYQYALTSDQRQLVLDIQNDESDR